MPHELDVVCLGGGYEGLGWRVDADFPAVDGFRVVQMTPPGSPCSIHFGKKVTTAAPGSIKNLYLVVSDIEAARGISPAAARTWARRSISRASNVQRTLR